MTKFKTRIRQSSTDRRIILANDYDLTNKKIFFTNDPKYQNITQISLWHKTKLSCTSSTRKKRNYKN